MTRKMTLTSIFFHHAGNNAAGGKKLRRQHLATMARLKLN
jgi:hypothetical protein